MNCVLGNKSFLLCLFGHWLHAAFRRSSPESGMVTFACVDVPEAEFFRHLFDLDQ